MLNVESQRISTKAAPTPRLRRAGTKVPPAAAAQLNAGACAPELSEWRYG